uniref:Ubiquitin-like protease family profile domain-containing protein n=1 Tax=Brassica oleracea TaxID=3712 RepID=A0A3P6D4E9_BRAOL|nr:unnamed protein product [Brassica oleracea]
MEEMRVSTAVKMLHKKMMKMMKEHAELLGDLDEFLSFPWGRVAFDMLMSSIKKRDEISLSQNTIALKGFALALQLVIVEDVPALTEVVQDSPSSSESESDDDGIEYPVRKAKKKTLSSAHAREVDKKPEVVVKSIIPQDPQRPVDESVFVWTDEVFDKKVENLVKLICDNFVFAKDMFKGGVTKAEVDKMREKSKVVGKKKKTRAKETQNVEPDEDKIVSIVLAILKPELKRLDGNLSAGLASMKELASSSLQYKDYMLATVSEMMKQMKSDILGSVGDGNAHVHVEGQHITPSTGNVSMPGTSKQPTIRVEEENAKTIGNVLEHLSHYSTPLDLQYMVLSDTTSRPENSSLPKCRRVGSINHEGTTVSVHLIPVSKEPLMHHVADLSSPAPVRDSTHQISNVSGHSQTYDSPRSAIPSFSLGLTQEIDAPNHGEDEEIGENETEPGLVREEDTLKCQKSKRLRTVPPYQLTGYQCGSAILNRAREGQLCGDRYYEMSDIREKYVRLSTILRRPCVINMAGVSVTEKYLIDIAERNRLLPGKVLYILMKHVRSTFDNQVISKADMIAAFLDSRFAALLCRKHPNFKKIKTKAAFLFSNSLVEVVRNSSASFTPATRFYLPFNIAKKHWIGLCLDFTASKLYVFDCNAGLRTGSALCKDLRPISDMFPLLLKQCGVSVAGEDKPLVVERIAGVAQNPNPGDAAVTTSMMIQTHSLFGPEACCGITPSVIPDEARRAAVMIYEFHVKL